MISLYSVSGGTKTESDFGFSIIKADTVIPALPATRDRTKEIAGKHGAYDYGADLKPIAFMLNCYFTDDVTDADIQSAIRTLNAYLLDGWGEPVDLTLTFSYETDKYYNVRYSGSHSIDTSAAMNRRKFTLPLMAFDPHAYATTGVTDTKSITTSPQLLTYSVTTGINIPVQLTLTNDSGADINGFSFITYDDIFDDTF
jgi:phage-related protein